MGRRRIWLLAVVLAVVATACYVPDDFDGDGRADVAWVDAAGNWSRAGEPSPFFSGPPLTGAVLTPGTSPGSVAGDYDGNHVWEPAVVVDDATWITGGGRGTFTFPSPPNQSQGANSAPTFLVPVPADYDGDGKTDAAWYRQSDATWWIEGQASPITFGLPHPSDRCSLDYSVPVPADYDGDGKADLAVYDPGSATFQVRGQPDAVPVGAPYDIPAVADYDGDGKADLAVVHPVTYDGDTSELLIVGRDPVTLPAGIANTEVLPLPANYDGTRGDEPALFLSPPGQGPQIWVAGTGMTPVPTGATPTATAAAMLAYPQLSFGRRDACATVP